VGITAGSREVPGRNACDRRRTYCIRIIKTAVLGTSHTIWKVLQLKLESSAVETTVDSREVPGRKGL